MFRPPPPQPLLAPAGYRIPIRGRATDLGPLGPLASRLGTPVGGRGRGKGRGKGKGRQRNRNRSKGNKKANNQPAENVKAEETKTEDVETSTIEIQDDNGDDNWQVISEETEETDSPKPQTDNFVDFRSDMFDTNTAEGFSTFSEPVLVISDDTEAAAAAPTEEVVTEEAESSIKDVAVEEVIPSEDMQANESQEITIVEDDSEPVTNESTKEQTKENKTSEKPSPTITAITAPKPPSPVEIKNSPYDTLYCEVILCCVVAHSVL